MRRARSRSARRRPTAPAGAGCAAGPAAAAPWTGRSCRRRRARSARRRPPVGCAGTAARASATWSVLVAEAVADAAHREDVFGLLGVGLELLAQVADVDVDRARVAVGRGGPHAREQHVAREDASGALGKGAEDLELDERGRDDLAAEADRALGGIDAQLAHLE